MYIMKKVQYVNYKNQSHNPQNISKIIVLSELFLNDIVL